MLNISRKLLFFAPPPKKSVFDIIQMTCYEARCVIDLLAALLSELSNSENCSSFLHSVVESRG